MIKKLTIKNFAIVDSLIIEFDEKFNVITGETGSGKTLIIKALDILLGGNLDKKMLRDNSKELKISAIFLSNQEFLEISRIYKMENLIV